VTRARGVAQAWIEAVADDPEATSALAVARERLAAGRSLVGLRRFRLFELTGPLPARDALEELFHRSTQFYNPHKERCAVRIGKDAAPLGRADERLILVVDRDGARRAAAERWWRHETGREVEVREAVVWALEFASGAPADALADELAILRDRRHGLFCNPHAQRARTSGPQAPLPWIVVGPRGDAA
jgi:hypothetical protein